MQRSPPPRRTWRRLVPLAVAAAALAVAGCQTLEELSPQARKSEAVSAKQLQQQSRNMRFADDYVGRLLETVHRAESPPADPVQRYDLSGWLLAQANAAYIDASGENPVVSTLDLLTLATLSRMVVETSGPARFPGVADGLVAVHRELEAAAWQLASEVLTPAQQADLRRLLQEWRAQNPDFAGAPFFRFQELAGQGVTPAANRPKLPTSLMGIVGLDPLSGLDPAVRQVEQSRLLAERAVYYAQRVPILIDLQLDRSLNRIAAGEESQRLVQNSSSLTSSAARFATVAEELPDTIAREREALIAEVSEMLNGQAATLTPMLLELRGALEAGHVAAGSVDQAVRSIDALVARLERKPGEPPRGKPFDVNDYTLAAAGITRAASELRQLLDATGDRAPEVGRALQASAAEGRSLVDYLFVRVAWLIGLLCLGLLATLLLYRWLAPRIPRP